MHASARIVCAIGSIACAAPCVRSWSELGRSVSVQTRWASVHMRKLLNVASRAAQQIPRLVVLSKTSFWAIFWLSV